MDPIFLVPKMSRKDTFAQNGDRWGQIVTNEERARASVTIVLPNRCGACEKIERKGSRGSHHRVVGELAKNWFLIEAARLLKTSTDQQEG